MHVWGRRWKGRYGWVKISCRVKGAGKDRKGDGMWMKEREGKLVVGKGREVKWVVEKCEQGEIDR